MSLNPVRIDTTEHVPATSADLYGPNLYYFAIDSRAAGDTKKLAASGMATTDWVKSWVNEQGFEQPDIAVNSTFNDDQFTSEEISKLDFVHSEGYSINCSAKNGDKSGKIGHFVPLMMPDTEADPNDFVLTYLGDGPSWQSTHGDLNNQGEGGRQADWNETDPKSPRYIWNKPAGSAFAFIDISIAGANTYTLVTQALDAGKMPVLVQPGMYGYKSYYTLETKRATTGGYVFRSEETTNNWDIVQEYIVTDGNNPQLKNSSMQLRLVSPPRQTEDNMIIVANSATGRADWKNMKWLLDGGQVYLSSRAVGDGYPNRYTMGIKMLSVEWYQMHPGIFVPLEKTSSSTSYSYKRTRFPQTDPVIATFGAKALSDPHSGGSAGNSNTLRYGSIISLNFTANLWKHEEYPAWIKFRLSAISDNNPSGNTTVDIKSVVLPGYEGSSSCPGAGSNQTINLNFHGMLGGWEDPRDGDEDETRYHLVLEIDRESLAEGHVLVEDGSEVKTTDFELSNYQISGIVLNND